MKRLVVVPVGLMAIVLFSAWGQAQQLAPEGRGLLPVPTAIPTALEGSTPTHPFAPDPSGTFARTVFETDEGPDFHLVIRDFSVPPDQQMHTIRLPTAAVLHVLSDDAEVSVAKQPLEVPGATRAADATTTLAAVPAGAPIDVVNRTGVAAVVRVYLVEAKQP